MKLITLSALIVVAISCNNNSGGDYNKPPKPGTSFEIIAVVTEKSGDKVPQTIWWGFVKNDSTDKIDTIPYKKILVSTGRPVFDSISFQPKKDSSGKIIMEQQWQPLILNKDSVNWRVEGKPLSELTKKN